MGVLLSEPQAAYRQTKRAYVIANKLLVGSSSLVQSLGSLWLCGRERGLPAQYSSQVVFIQLIGRVQILSYNLCTLHTHPPPREAYPDHHLYTEPSGFWGIYHKRAFRKRGKAQRNDKCTLLVSPVAVSLAILPSCPPVPRSIIRQ